MPAPIRALAFVLIAMLGIVPAMAQSMPESQAQLQELFDQQHYQEALRLSSRVLTLRKLPDGFDRTTLLSIKAESLLRLRQTPAAIHAFEELVEATEEPQARAVATATVALLKKSAAGQYQPERRDRERDRPPAIDVIDPASRSAAIRALADDELRPVPARVKRLVAAGRLPPMLELLEQLRPLATLERAASGTAEKTEAIVAEVIEAASAAMVAALQQMNETTDEIEARAFSLPQDAPANVAANPPGLTKDDTDQLQRIMLDAARIASTTEAFAKDGDAMARQSLQQVALDATALRDRAAGVIRRDLSEQVRRGGGRPRE